MKKGGARPNHKRVSAAPKERRCGVPCTLLVAAWSLFLLLLLTSSISHEDDEHAQQGFFHTKRPWTALFRSLTVSSRHALFGPEDSHLRGHHHEHFVINQLVGIRNGEHYMQRGIADSIFPRLAVLGESDFATQEELTGGRPFGTGDHHPDRDFDNTIVSSSVSTSDEKAISGDRDGELHQSHISGETKMEQPSASSGVVLPTRITFQELGEPIDALQYAEYGAGLLLKSGPVEEDTKICLIRNPGGTSCGVIRNHVELSGEKCIWPQVVIPASTEGKENVPCLPEDVLVEEHCYDASSYGGDIVAELRSGGESYLVCQTDPLAGTALCGVVCNTESDCLLSGAEYGSSPCLPDGSSRDYFLSPCQQMQQKDDGQPVSTASIADESVSSELPARVETGSQQLPSQSEVQQEDDLSSPMHIENDSNVGPRDVEESNKKSQEGNADIVTEDKIDLEDVDDSSKLVEDVIVDEVDPNDVEFLAPLVNSELTGRESLVSPAEDGAREEEELDLDGELLVPLLADTTQLLGEEPRRLKRVGSVMSLDEYKRTILESQRKNGNQENLSSVQAQKVRHSDESYNYASASHGAKVLAANKESKGASHILTSDKDKYLRNPCGAEDKYVITELSEEVFVDTVVISNFEFHSSNLKDFEVFGSPVYPTKDWISLGKFQAENVRNRQKFTIEDPKLVRHLMIKMLSHWGNEFFCTLSIFEVFGVDVIKNLFEDWIALEEGDNGARTQGSTGSAVSQEESATTGGAGQKSEADAALDAPFSEPLFSDAENRGSSSADQGGVTGSRNPSGKTAEGVHMDEDPKSGTAGDFAATQEVIHRDSVLKILMQRVKALELNQTLFDLYLGDLNQKYKVMLSELDKDLALVTERLRNETILTASLAMRLADRELQRKEEKLYMEHRFAQIASNFTDNLDFMRWQIQSMERREITAILLAFLCMILSALLHLLASCLPRRNPPTREFAVQATSGEEMVISKLCPVDSKLDTPSLSAVCQRSSSFILYLACGLIILVLSV